MTERRQVWLIVGACLAVYAAIMFGFSVAIREPVKWLVGGADHLFGPILSGVVILSVPALVGIWALWPDKGYVAPPPPRLPHWVRLIGNAYFLLLGIGLIIAFAAVIIAG